MQTAMQQLINEIVEHLTYDDDLTEDSRNTLEKMRIKCESKLEMEKNKMIEFAEDYIENFTYGNYDGEVYQSKELADYFDETYGSKGSDEQGSSLEWNGEVTQGSNGNFKQFSLYEHKETIATANTPTSYHGLQKTENLMIGSMRSMQWKNLKNN